MKMQFKVLLTTLILTAATTWAANTVMVGGAAMYPSRNIIDNAVHSGDHTTLVALVKAAGLVQALEGPGPFTVFAPTDAAFRRLPAGTVKNLMKPENKAGLTKILTYHVVAGKWDYDALAKAIKKGDGRVRARLKKHE